MAFLHSFAKTLSGLPQIKRTLKDVYQFAGNVVSDKKSLSHGLTLETHPEFEHMFGYYDKSPWNADNSQLLYMRVAKADKLCAPGEFAQIIIKRVAGGSERIVASTSAWNVQQGCMLQWLGPDFDSKIIFNDCIDSKLVSVVLDINTAKKTVLDMPVYSVDSSGEIAVGLDFLRLHRLRPGYGYANIPDSSANYFCPLSDAIWRMDIAQNLVTPLISYTQIAAFEPSASMIGAEHKINHIMLRPDGKRFMFLHRWINKNVRYTRLLTVNTDGSDMYNLLDEGMVSHCNWCDNDTVVAWAHTRSRGDGYYLLTDRTRHRADFLPKLLTRDGHPSFSPDGKWLVTDTYPDFKRKQHLILCDIQSGEAEVIAQLYAPLRYTRELHCDLHPRWSRDSKQICIDSAHLGTRQVFTVAVQR